MKSTASHQVVCDSCGQVLGEYGSNSSKGHISVSLPSQSECSNTNSANKEPFDGKGYNSQQNHYCSESCLASDLNKRAKTKSKMAKTAKANVIGEDGILLLDIQAKKI